MKRRYVAAALAAFMLAGTSMAQQPANLSVVRQPKAKTGKPYGADGLENTDPQQFKESLTSQLRKAGLSLPDWDNPFRSFSTVARNIADTSPDRKAFNEYFSTGRFGSCAALAIDEMPVAWKTYSALYSVAGYVATHTKKNGKNLNENVFSHVNGTSKRDFHDYYVSLNGQSSSDTLFKKAGLIVYGQVNVFAGPAKDDRQRQLADKLLVADRTSSEIPLRVGAAAATLYAFSNYGGKARNESFLKTLLDYYRAQYMDDVPVSSIEAAVDAFSKRPREGLSIGQTVEWAAEVVRGQFKGSLEQMATDMRDNYKVKMAFLSSAPEAHEFFLPADRPPDNKDYDDIRDILYRATRTPPGGNYEPGRGFPTYVKSTNDVYTILDAREFSCGLSPIRRPSLLIIDSEPLSPSLR